MYYIHTFSKRYAQTLANSYTIIYAYTYRNEQAPRRAFLGFFHRGAAPIRHLAAGGLNIVLSLCDWLHRAFAHVPPNEGKPWPHGIPCHSIGFNLLADTGRARAISHQPTTNQKKKTHAKGERAN